jgi:hypothetical protein
LRDLPAQLDQPASLVRRVPKVTLVVQPALLVRLGLQVLLAELVSTELQVRLG